MKTRQAATPWSHEAYERRGYRKCPLCWRHIVKIEEHVAAHEAGRIGADGKRRDRTAEEARRWAHRYNGAPATDQFRAGVRRMFVSPTELNRILSTTAPDPKLLHEVDDAVEQDH